MLTLEIITEKHLSPILHNVSPFLYVKNFLFHFHEFVCFLDNADDGSIPGSGRYFQKSLLS